MRPTMKALVKERPEPGLSLLDIPTPRVRHVDDVLFKVEYCAICVGETKVYDWNEWAASDKTLELPTVLGHEASGVVVEVGEPLPWIRPTLAEAALTCRLHSRAVARLHGLTEPLLLEPVSKELSRHTLVAAYEGVLARGGTWFDVPIYAEAMRRLQPLLEAIHTPLVFSNGDYNPLNYLHEGDTLTGWLDFAHACFEDPYIGLAKFIVWGFDTLGWGTGVQVGLVERHLYDRNVSRSEFTPRLFLDCLYRLQTEVSVNNQRDAPYRQAVLRVLEESLSW
jgi:hypothetical protein